MAYVKFNCDDTIKLEQQPVPWEETRICNEIRQTNKFRPLKERYKALEEVRKTGCPYEPKN